MDRSDIAKRMKGYEAATTREKFLPLIPVCARIDGRSFSKFTKGLKRPYDEAFSKTMVATTKKLVEETGAVIGYTQSDEISLVWLQESADSQIFFDGKKFKMVSNIASMATIYFYQALVDFLPERLAGTPTFDCRVWQVPTKEEAVNYLVWREMDATKNSVSMLAQAHYSHGELHKKNGSDMQDMLMEKGINWNDEPSFFKRGTYVRRTKVVKAFDSKEISKLPKKHRARMFPDLVMQRTIIEELDMPKITSVINRKEVVFNGHIPITSPRSEVSLAVNMP